MLILHVIATILIFLIIVSQWGDTLEVYESWGEVALQALLTLALVFVTVLSWVKI